MRFIRKIRFKRFVVQLFAVTILACSCSGKSDIIIEDFEFTGSFADSPYGAWTEEGDAFNGSPTRGIVEKQNEVTGYLGSGYVNSFHGGDDSQGSLLSYEFTIERDFINFLIGGGNHPGTYIELLVDRNSVRKSAPIFPIEELNWMAWNVKDLKGKKARVRIVDHQQGGWGHTLVDQIEMGNKDKSTFGTKHVIREKIEKKYILLPIEDKAREYQLTIEHDGKSILEPIMVRLAEKQIDYWVPVDVEKYIGKELSLKFDYNLIDAIGLKNIKQSDSFNFDYNEPTRPDYHFSAPYGWINDPNGMFWKDGEYHLYYQYNPYGTRWGNMHWGHATSKDLIKWKYMPVALAPDPLGAIFSGSAVVDRQNTAGFGKDAIIAVYTSFKGYQVQSIAYSNDNGTTFTKYQGNPVLKDDSATDFRDPKVMWHKPTSQWIMSLSTGRSASFYASKDLKKWEMLSSFEGGSQEGIWECTDLFPLDYNGIKKWVLLTSITEGQPNADCATQYFIGDFDGKTFKADPLPYPLWVDYGCDNYAGVTWNDAPDNRTIFIGWMANHYYAYATPSHNFRNAMTIPRDLKLVHNGKHLVLAGYPVKELENARALSCKIDDMAISDLYTVNKISKDNRGTYDIEFTVTPSSDKPFSFTLSNNHDEKLSFHFDRKAETITVDRSKSGKTDFHPKFNIKPIVAPLSNKKQYAIRLLIDKASSELFINEGETIQSNVIYPSSPYNTIEFDSGGGELKLTNMSVYDIK